MPAAPPLAAGAATAAGAAGHAMHSVPLTCRTRMTACRCRWYSRTATEGWLCTMSHRRGLPAERRQQQEWRQEWQQEWRQQSHWRPAAGSRACALLAAAKSAALPGAVCPPSGTAVGRGRNPCRHASSPPLTVQLEHDGMGLDKRTLLHRHQLQAGAQTPQRLRHGYAAVAPHKGGGRGGWCAGGAAASAGRGGTGAAMCLCRRQAAGSDG